MTQFLIIMAVLAALVALADGKLKQWVDIDLSGTVTRVFAALVSIACIVGLSGWKLGWWNPKDSQALYSEGIRLQQKGKFEQAIETYTDALENTKDAALGVKLNKALAECREGFADDILKNNVPGVSSNASAIDLFKTAAENRNSEPGCDDCAQQEHDLETASELDENFPDTKLARAWEDFARREMSSGDPAAAARGWAGVLEFKRDPLAYKELAAALGNSGLDRESSIANGVAACLKEPDTAAQNMSPAALAQGELVKARSFDPNSWSQALCHYERARTLVLANQLHDNWTGYLFKDFANALNQIHSYCRALREVERAKTAEHFNFENDVTLGSIIRTAREGCPNSSGQN